MSSTGGCFTGCPEATFTASSVSVRTRERRTMPRTKAPAVPRFQMRSLLIRSASLSGGLTPSAMKRDTGSHVSIRNSAFGLQLCRDRVE